MTVYIPENKRVQRVKVGTTNNTAENAREPLKLTGTDYQQLVRSAVPEEING